MELKEIGKNMLTSCLNVKAGEQVLIVTDDKKISIGTALYEAAQELGAEALMMTMTPRQVSGEEPPAAVAAATFAKVRRVMVNEAMVLLLSNESDPSSDTARPYRARPGRTIGLGARFWRKCNK